jgi:hypothetical protein
LDDVPTLGEPGETTWQGLWDWDGIYILIRVTDDDFYPHYAVDPPGLRWEYDSPELYFDVNATLEDGQGPLPDDRGGGNRHYEFAPSFDAGKIDGTATTETNGFQYAFLVDDPNYTAEYFIPLPVLLDDEGYIMDPTREVGFDITLIDRDLGDDSARIAVWSNTGIVDDSWTNMDDCGVITFDDATISTFIEEINLTDGEINENNGKLQIVAEIVPENASNKNLGWKIENSTGKATIDQHGVVRAIIDGEVTVTASALDGSYEEATAYVTISNQIVSVGEVNVFRNPNFDEVNADGTPVGYGFWGGVNNDPAPFVDDGILFLTPGEPAEVWNYEFSQSGLTAEPDIDYIFSFVAWADETRTFTCTFEDNEENEYNRYGHTEDPRVSWGDSRSDWTFDITTEPTRYTFDVLFDQILENTVQNVTFQLGLSEVDAYMDSLMLVSLEDFYRLTDYMPVEAIIVTGADGAAEVTLDATLQMSAEVLPAEADYPAVKWSVVDGTGGASIDENGLLTPESAGNVTVVASAVDDSNVSGELEVTIGWPEGISPARANRLKVYPNPAVNELNIVLERENSTVSIYNSLGMKLEEIVVRGTEYRLDIGGYAPGIYFIRSGNAVTKFVK